MENRMSDTILIWISLLVCAGRFHRFHGVRSRSESGDAGEDGAQAALVFQTVWRGWKRLHRPARTPEHHQGRVHNVPVAPLLQSSLIHCAAADYFPLPQAIRAINGNENQETTAEEFTNRVFDRIDVNGDGECVLAPCGVGGRCYRTIITYLKKFSTWILI